MDFVALTIEVLSKLAHFAGSYGMAIVIFTILMRMCLWQLNVSQQRSMKNMQNLAPKLKMIQEIITIEDKGFFDICPCDAGSQSGHPIEQYCQSIRDYYLFHL